jgi:hypothetical protein
LKIARSTVAVEVAIVSGPETIDEMLGVECGGFAGCVSKLSSETEPALLKKFASLVNTVASTVEKHEATANKNMEIISIRISSSPE